MFTVYSFAQIRPKLNNAPPPPPPPKVNQIKVTLPKIVKDEEVKPYEKIEEIKEDQVISTITHDLRTDVVKWIQTHEYSKGSFSNTYEIDLKTYKEANGRKDSIRILYNNDIKSDYDSRVKDPFETTQQYNRRINDVTIKYRNIYYSQNVSLDSQIISLEKKVYLKKSSININFSIDKYNADKSEWEINIKAGVQSYKAIIEISPEEAKKLWLNISELSISDFFDLKGTLKEGILITYSNQSELIVLKKIHISSNGGQPMDDDENKIFTKVEFDAAFTGGESAWRRYLTNNLDAGVPGNEGAPAGTYTVVVRFVVAKDGSVSDVVAETNHGYGMEQESVRAVIKSGKWRPATQNGRQVTAYKRQPITWVVQE